MKKLFLLIGLIVFLNNCAQQPYNEFKADSSYKYYAKAKSYSGPKTYQAGSGLNQAHANEIALRDCNLWLLVKDCYIQMEGDNNVWEKNVAHLKAKELEEKKRKEEEEKKKEEEEKKKEEEKIKKKEEALLASIELKRNVCKKMGFVNETDSMANCILQLMLEENKSSSNSSSSSSLSSAMKEQTRIMENQLRLQRLEQTRENMQRFNYMMQYGKVPMW
jgi:hypothetical protein